MRATNSITFPLKHVDQAHMHRDKFSEHFVFLKELNQINDVQCPFSWRLADIPPIGSQVRYKTINVIIDMILL